MIVMVTIVVVVVVVVLRPTAASAGAFHVFPLMVWLIATARPTKGSWPNNAVFR
jgi:hypothetical protein